MDVTEDLETAPKRVLDLAREVFPEIDPEDLPQLRFLYVMSRTGLSESFAARVSGVSRHTVSSWKGRKGEKYDRYREALARAKELGFQEYVDFGLAWATAPNPRDRSERIYLKFLEAYGGDRFTGKQQVEHSVHAKLLERGSERRARQEPAPNPLENEREEPVEDEG